MSVVLLYLGPENPRDGIERVGYALLILSCTGLLWVAARVTGNRVVATLRWCQSPCPYCGAPRTSPQEDDHHNRVAQLHHSPSSN